MNERIISDFSNVKVGDYVWHISEGCCEVTHTTEYSFSFKTKEGYYKDRLRTGAYNDSVNADTFWAPIIFEIPPRPKKKVLKVEDVWINENYSGRHIHDTESAAKRNAKDCGQSTYKYIARPATITYEVEE